MEHEFVRLLNARGGIAPNEKLDFGHAFSLAAVSSEKSDRREAALIPHFERTQDVGRVAARGDGDERAGARRR